jgi:hypothetical protein
MGRVSHEADGVGEHIKGMLEQLKGDYGRRSGIGELVETLKGAGALAGLTLIGQGLAEATAKAGEMVEKFREGKEDASGVAVAIGESIPILGGWVTAGQNIRELFTGEKEDIAKINEEIKLSDELFKGMNEQIEIQRKGEEDIASQLRKANEERRIALALTPGQKAAAEMANKAEDAQHAADEDQKTFAASEAKRLSSIKETLAKERDLNASNEDSIRADAMHNFALRDAAGKTFSQNWLHYSQATHDAIIKAGDDAVMASRREVDVKYDLAVRESQNAVKAHQDGLNQIAAMQAGTSLIESGKKYVESEAKNAQTWLKGWQEAFKKNEEAGDKAREHVIHGEDTHKIDDVTKALDELAKQSRQVGMTEGQKKIDDLYAMHAGPAAIAAATLYESHIEAVNKAKEESRRLDEEAKSAIAESLTPLQKEQEKVAELQKLYDTGRLSKEQFAQAQAKAEKELHGEAQHNQEGATRGSAEAFKLMDKINNRDKGTNPLEAIAQKHLAATEKQTSLLQKIAQKTGNLLMELVPIGAA